ncbi:MULTISPECIES: immunity 52 family protein [Herbaspirillum]|nr:MULTISPECIES: immunity 52 family protein [Herbaspirillum]
MELFFRRGQPTLIDVPTQLQELYEFTRAVESFSPLFHHWLLSSDKSKVDALLYKAFDENGPTAQALAVLEQRSKGVTDIRSISLWNGADVDAQSAGLSSLTNVLGRPDSIEFSLRLEPEVNDWRTPVVWLKKAISIWNPSFAVFGPYWYSDHKVFEDRPGASWMLYLPCVLDAQQVPDARAIVPVMGKDEKGKVIQTGTIVVSITDEPFSDENPEHVKVANAIEIRLVDQDLLPRFGDV